MSGMSEKLFTVLFETTKGNVTLEVNHNWAPRGAERLHTLVDSGFYDDIAFFRVLTGFVAQFGISGNPGVGGQWKNRSIEDDPVAASNKRGTVTFAAAGPNSRTTQLFINLADNESLDDMGFSPVAVVVDGMDVVERLYAGYGEGAPRGSGPEQPRIHAEGNDYLRSSFPELDYITRATLITA